MELSWTRRSRVRCGWLDDVDMPLGEWVEQYSVTVSAGGKSLDYVCGVPALTIEAADLALLGAEEAVVAVKQVGDWGASRAADTQITLA